MIASKQEVAERPPILRFPSEAERDGRIAAGAALTLRDYYEQILLPELSDLSPRSLESDRLALRKWERFTANPDLTATPAELEGELKAFRDGMVDAGASPASVNKHWRELRAMFQAAFDDGLCDGVPIIRERRRGRVRKSRLVSESRMRQREILTDAELDRLVSCCKFATYPSAGQFPAPKLWRVALCLFWHYGIRTHDVFDLRWSDVRFGEGLLLFKASKTSKLQGLPLTSNVAEHLRSIKGFSEMVFPGFVTPGCYLKKSKRWKPGYYSTWRREIAGKAALVDPVTFKHFRQRVVTRFNSLRPGLGSWIAGHFVPGVSAQNYELPTVEIRDVLNAEPVPESLREIW